MNQFTMFLLIHTFLDVSGDPNNGPPPQTQGISIPSSLKTISEFDPTLLPNEEPNIHPTANERQLTEGRQLGGTQFIHERTSGKCRIKAITSVGGKWFFYNFFFSPRNIS